MAKGIEYREFDSLIPIHCNNFWGGSIVLDYYCLAKRNCKVFFLLEINEYDPCY